MTQVLENEELEIVSKETCYHCGESNQGHPIELDNKFFCCEGCKMVFSILSENNLCNYYDLNSASGVSQKSVNPKEYSFLDDQDVIDKLIDFTDGEKTKARFYIPQIHCSSCLWLLENLYSLKEGIMHSRVDFLKKEVTFIFSDKHLTLRSLVELLASIGYAPYIQLNDLEDDKRPITDKSLFYKLGLAGFAFGNIMLFSFPEYLGLAHSSESAFNAFFAWANLILILPVILYSGQDYLRSAYQGLKHGHLNIDVPVSLGILALFFRSAYEIVSGIGPGYLDSLAGLIFFLLIGRWFQQVTYARISFDRDFKSYFPIACTVIRDDKEQQLSLDKLKAKDRVLVKHGELIPADGYLVRGKAMIDYSFVTGESALISKNEGDILYAGGKQMGSVIELVVSKKVSNSYLTELWNDPTFKKEENEGEVNVLADKVARFFTIVILVVAFSTLFYWIRIDMSTAINAFTSVLIIACPCAVALSIPFTFGNVLRIFARSNIYLKNIQVIEKLADINHLVFDKTGTITNVHSVNMDFEGDALSKEEKKMIFSIVRNSNHPLSRQLYKFLEGKEYYEPAQFNELEGKGLTASFNNRNIRIGSENFITGNSNNHDPLSSSIFIEIDGRLKGKYLIRNNYRKGLSLVIDKLKSIGELSLISGDNNSESKNVEHYFGKSSRLFFNQKPVDKLNYLKNLRNSGNNVSMIGDGLNDAGALTESDVGIVITENTSNFTPACDIIMDANQFHKLPLIYNFAQTSIRIVLFSYLIALIYNVVGLSFAVQGLLSPVIAAILMPLSSITIVLFGVGLSSYLARQKNLV
ncbi:MAG: HAD-IC family P-type ATPase [Saprospiraceae bacterium]|nr:HAD-IC family P-type ATPase [Saprospiraceae bacterium]